MATAQGIYSGAAAAERLPRSWQAYNHHDDCLWYEISSIKELIADIEKSLAAVETLLRATKLVSNI